MAQECGSIDISALVQRLAAIENRLASVDGKLSAQAGQLSAIQQAIASLRSFVASAFSQLTGQLAATGNEIKNAVGAAFQKVEDLVGSAFNELKNFLAATYGEVKALFNRILQFFENIFGNRGADQEVLNKLRDIDRALQSVQNALLGLRGTISEISRQIDRVYGYLDRIASSIQEALRYVRGILDLAAKLDAIGGTLGQIRGGIDRIFEAIRGIKAPDLSAINGRLNKIEGLLNRILNAIGGIRFKQADLTEVLKALNNLLSLVQGLKTQIVQSLKEIIINAIRELFQGLFRGRGKDDEILAKLRDIDRALQSVQNVLLGLRGKIDQILAAVRGLGSANLERIYNYLDRIAGLVQQVLSYVKAIPDIYQAVTKPGKDFGDLINQVLAEIRKIPPQLTKLGTAIGVNDLPANLPTTLISKRGQRDTTQSVPSIAQLLAWQTQQFDALMGQWEIEIEIQDTDLTRAGNQTKKVALPNLAEAVAEQVGLLMNLTTSVDALLNIGMRTLSEAGLAHKEAAISHVYGRENAQFLGYEGRETNIEIPFCFNPGATTLEATLKNTNVKIRAWENVDKQDLRFYFHEFLTATAIIRAVYWQQVDPKRDIKKQIISLVKQAAKVSEGSAEGEDRWDEFLDRVESGFTSEAGISDPTNPYGRDPLRRPRIRKLGANKVDGGSGGLGANFSL